MAAGHASGARLVVVTRGERGALVSLDGERTELPGVPVRVADAVAAAELGTRVAALTCSVPGPNSPWAHQLGDLATLAAL